MVNQVTIFFVPILKIGFCHDKIVSSSENHFSKQNSPKNSKQISQLTNDSL
jgi:hypothetical protein